MPQDRLEQRARATVVQVARDAAWPIRIEWTRRLTERVIGEAEAPQRRGSPLVPVRAEIREALAHVMEQEVAERLDHLTRELARLGIARGDEVRHVTAGATCGLEQHLAAERRRIAVLRAWRYRQRANV